MKPGVEDMMNIIAETGVKVVFTSAGSPKKWTGWLKERGITVVHVVSSSKFAKKCEDAGVDAVVAEGFEAGGHNGREETTTMCLIPAVRKATTLPLIAAGGIGNGPSMLAAYALGAEGVQIGTRFALTVESSASEAYKNFCLNLDEGDTMLILKKLSPTRMAKNPYREQLDKAEAEGATAEQLLEIIGAGRNRMGIFEGDLENGEVEIGQNASQFKGKGIQTVAEVMTEMLKEYQEAKEQLYSV
jgi:enoyl-[acyl-carrier protein] reductase II